MQFFGDFPGCSTDNDLALLTYERLYFNLAQLRREFWRSINAVLC